MSRLLGATLLATAQAEGPIVSFYCVNACDDGTQHDYCINNSTSSMGCSTAPAGCHLMAWQTLYNEGTCEAFKASEPTCFGEGHGADSGRCPGASTFQLVMDRNRDLDRTYAAGDFAGVAQNLYQKSAVLVEDSSVQTDIAKVYSDWASTQDDIARIPYQILAKNFTSDWQPQTLHEMGSWKGDKDVRRYTRWEFSGEPYGWQIETDVQVEDTGSFNQPGDYTDAIRDRYAAYSKLSQAGNISGLVSDLYTEDALLVFPSGDFVEGDNLEKVLGQIFDLSPTRKYDVTSAVGKDGADVVHDVGTAMNDISPSNQYYARWEKRGEEWKIAVQFQVASFEPPSPSPTPPPTPPTPPPPAPDQACAAHPACSGLAGNCCPTDDGVTLDCCHAASCSSHPECASLGLAGNCCPSDSGVQLDCCGSSSVSV